MAKRILKLTLNGTPREVAAEPNAILLDVIREALTLTGTKRGCDMGTCGCCTVLMDGVPVLSCLTLAATAEGASLTTIEGVGSSEALHPVQRAFSECGGSQCGFCTPGFIMTTCALLEENPSPSDGEIREALSGNLCRCTGYVKIFDAVRTAAKDLQERKAAPVPRVGGGAD